MSSSAMMSAGVFAPPSASTASRTRLCALGALETFLGFLERLTSRLNSALQGEPFLLGFAFNEFLQGELRDLAFELGAQRCRLRGFRGDFLTEEPVLERRGIELADDLTLLDDRSLGNEGQDCGLALDRAHDVHNLGPLQRAVPYDDALQFGGLDLYGRGLARVLAGWAFGLAEQRDARSRGRDHERDGNRFPPITCRHVWKTPVAGAATGREKVMIPFTSDCSVAGRADGFVFREMRRAPARASCGSQTANTHGTGSGLELTESHRGETAGHRRCQTSPASAPHSAGQPD